MSLRSLPPFPEIWYPQLSGVASGDQNISHRFHRDAALGQRGTEPVSAANEQRKSFQVAVHTTRKRLCPEGGGTTVESRGRLYPGES